MPLISSLYINYIFQGIAAIVISQNMSKFQEQWQASISQVTLVISAIGLGRILFLNFSGLFSDRIGRKQAVLVGGVSYILFYLGILLASNYWQAFIVALLAGCGNAFLDTSTYPALVEAFPAERNNSALSVLNKAFISIGQFVFPILTSWTLKNHLYFGWTMLACALGLVVNVLILTRLTFPENKDKLLPKKESITVLQDPLENSAKFQIEGLALLIFSFISVSLFNIFILWIPTFSERVLNISQSNSLLFVSVYSICSFLSVFATSYIVVRKVNIPRLMIICVSLTALALTYMLFFPSMLSVIVASVAVGFFAAGGIWQLGLAILLEFFSHRRGLVTSYYSLATALSVMATPYITGLMAEKNIYIVFVYNALLACLGILALIIVKRRYETVISHKS